MFSVLRVLAHGERTIGLRVTAPGGRSTVPLLVAYGGRRTVLLGLMLGSRAASAQTDFYNLDAGRPLRVQDALVIERHALEWQLAPLRLSGAGGMKTRVELEPEIAWGVLPRTQIEMGLPVRWASGANSKVALAGIDLSVLYALNAETLTWPGLAVSLGALLPAGADGPSHALIELGALATRTLSGGRVHVNAAITPGKVVGRLPHEAARWRVGVAADRTLAVRSLLFGTEVVAERPLGGAGVLWSAAVGSRYQVGPRSALDVGVGRRFESNGEWFVTMGSAVSFGVPRRSGGAR